MTNIKNNGDGTYTLTLTGLPNVDDVNEVNIRYKGTAKKGFTINVEDISYSLTYSEGNVWAKEATVGISNADAAQKALVAKYATFYIGTTSGSLSAAKSVTRDEANYTVTISGLTAGTKYYVAAKLSIASEYCAEISFTTEAATDVPNGNFETTTQKIKWTDIWQGGEYTNLNSGVFFWKNPFHNYEQFIVNEPTGWATTNAKTCCESAKNKNTWFTSPSVFNTPNSSTYTVTNSTNSSDYKTYSVSYGDAHGGSTAMMLRSIGWDLNGTTPSVDRRDGYGDNYPTKNPTVANKAAAKLFLGSYSFSANTSSQDCKQRDIQPRSKFHVTSFKA